MQDKTVNLNLDQAAPPAIIHVTQGDTAWRWHFPVWLDGTRWTIPSGAKAILKGTKPDGHVFAYSGSISSNEVVVDCALQMTICAGPVGCTLIILDTAGKRLHVARIALLVAADPEAVFDVASDSALPAYAEVLDGIGELLELASTIPDDLPGYITNNVDAWLASHIDPSTGYALDDTLTLSNAAAPADKVGELKSAVGTDAIIEFAGQISSGAWVADSRLLSVLIAVKPGSHINVKATSVGNSSLIGAIKNVTLPITNGTPVTYSSDPSWANEIFIAKDQSFSGTAPTDIEYLYYYCGLASSNFSRMPMSVEIDGYNYLQSVIKNLSETNAYLYETGEHLSVVENKTDNIQTLKNLLRRYGSIEGGVWTQSDRFMHILYPVNPGDIVEVFGKENNIADIAGIKTSSMEWGNSPQYSETNGWNTTISITNAQHWYGVIPDDVNYLYLYYGTNGARLPSIVKLNGYNIVASITENVVKTIAENIANINNYEYWGLAEADKWSEISNNRYSYAVIPIKNGDKIEIITNSQSTSAIDIAFLRTYSNPVNGATLDFSNEENFAEFITVQPNHYASFIAPQDANYIFFYEGISTTKVRKPKIVLVNGFDVITGKLIANEAATKIRLMQYNIGKFSFGYSNNPEASTFGLLSLIAYDVPGQVRKHQDYTYDEYVTYYKKMLCDYQPDIIGMEEYLTPINVMRETDPSDYVTKNMGDEVFDTTYPYEVFKEARQQCQRSKHEAIASRVEDLSYTVDDVSYNISFTVSYYNYNGKIICVACHALTSDSTNLGMARRSAELQAILESFEYEDFVFLTFDVNNDGNYRSSAEGTPGYVSSPEEGEQLRAIAESKGWAFTNGGYLPFEKSWFAPDGSGYVDRNMTIDNIIYKNNGKIILSGVEVMPVDEAKKLSSDHCPLIVDFLLK